MKLFSVVAWISGILSVVMMTAGAVGLITNIDVFGVKHEINFFFVTNSLLLLAILCVLARQGCIGKKD